MVVVADIRKSQDLMTYASSPKEFKEMMLGFIDKSRDLIKHHYGIFDKFTGDGFIAYFNEDVCKPYNYVDCFVNFVKDLMKFSMPYFEDWAKKIRKLPPGSCGLSIGADIGLVDFSYDNHFFAIGDALVWANRVANAEVKVNEVRVNNLLYNEIKETSERLEDYDINFKSIDSVTKAGENLFRTK